MGRWQAASTRMGGRQALAPVPITNYVGRREAERSSGLDGSHCRSGYHRGQGGCELPPTGGPEVPFVGTSLVIILVGGSSSSSTVRHRQSPNPPLNTSIAIVLLVDSGNRSRNLHASTYLAYLGIRQLLDSVIYSPTRSWLNLPAMSGSSS